MNMFNKLIRKIKCLPQCKLLGGLLIAAGSVLLLCFMPGWAWGTVLGVALIAAGIYIFTL